MDRNDNTVTINVPQHVLVNAFLEKMTRTYSGVRDLPASAILDDCLPEIGQPLHGGIYAGKTVHGNQFFALILLPGDEEKPWKDAMAWAEQHGGYLPTRMDMLVLWQNLKSEFKEEWYWTSEEYARSADYAWIQLFNNGYQITTHKSDDYRCRAVRRVAL